MRIISHQLLFACPWLLTMCLLWTYPSTLLSAPGSLFFSAPYSGEKVEHYEVTLPVTREGQQTFVIPADCQSADEALAHGASRWGNRVERSIWRKVQMDCRYVSFLLTFPHQPLHDYVSGYDFMNAELQDISILLDCTDARMNDNPNQHCREFHALGLEGFSFLFPWKSGDASPSEENTQTCRINNGIFRGRIIYNRSGTHCIQDPKAPGFRVIAIDYADVNGDTFLDAILRLVPLGIGLRRVPIVLPLTRKEPGGIFTIPHNIPGPVPSH